MLKQTCRMGVIWLGIIWPTLNINRRRKKQQTCNQVKIRNLTELNECPFPIRFFSLTKKRGAGTTRKFRLATWFDSKAATEGSPNIDARPHEQEYWKKKLWRLHLNHLHMLVEDAHQNKTLPSFRVHYEHRRTFLWPRECWGRDGNPVYVSLVINWRETTLEVGSTVSAVWFHYCAGKKLRRALT